MFKCVSMYEWSCWILGDAHLLCGYSGMSGRGFSLPYHPRAQKRSSCDFTSFLHSAASVHIFPFTFTIPLYLTLVSWKIYSGMFRKITGSMSKKNNFQLICQRKRFNQIKRERSYWMCSVCRSHMFVWREQSHLRCVHRWEKKGRENEVEYQGGR